MKHQNPSDDAIRKILESARMTVVMDRCMGQTVGAMDIVVAGR